jgi:cell division protein FtsB
MIETLDDLRASAEIEIYREVEQDENVIDRIAAAQREELEREIATLQAEAERVAEEARELAGEVPF